jgi:hypothetical protein
VILEPSALSVTGIDPTSSLHRPNPSRFPTQNCEGQSIEEREDRKDEMKERKEGEEE